MVLPPSGTAATLTVTSPGEGAVVGSPFVTVFGSFTGPANSGINIEGKLALSDFANFTSRPIALTVGANAIDVVLTTQDGQTQTVTRNVVYDPQQAPDIALSSTTAGDQTPFLASFELTPRSGLGLDITRIRADFNGDGQNEIDTTNLATPLNFNYTEPGAFTASFIVTLSDSSTRTITHRIVALNPNQTRFTVCGVYGDMRTRLVAQNISSALLTLHPEMRPEFQTLWTNLGAQLPTVAAGLGRIADGIFSTKSAELLVIEPVTGQQNQFDGFRGGVERDRSGVWRIVSM